MSPTNSWPWLTGLKRAKSETEERADSGAGAVEAEEGSIARETMTSLVGSFEWTLGLPSH